MGLPESSKSQLRSGRIKVSAQKTFFSSTSRVALLHPWTHGVLRTKYIMHRMWGITPSHPTKLFLHRVPPAQKMNLLNHTTKPIRDHHFGLANLLYGVRDASSVADRPRPKPSGRGTAVRCRVVLHQDNGQYVLRIPRRPETGLDSVFMQSKNENTSQSQSNDLKGKSTSMDVSG